MHRISAIAEEDLPQLFELLDLVFRPNAADTMEMETPQLFAPNNLRNCRVIYENGRVVSHIGLLFRNAFVLGRTLSVCLIGAVATHPDARGRGLATELLQHCMDFARERGAHVLMISGGRGLYLRNGARSVGSQHPGTLAAQQLADLQPDAWELRQLASSDLPTASFFYRCKPIHFERPLDEWKLMHRHGKAQAGNARYLGCYRGERLEGYLVVSPPDKEGKVRLFEHAGLRDARLAGLKHLLGKEDASLVTFDLHASETEMLEAVRTLGAKLSATTVPGTVRVLAFEPLMEQFRPWLAEQIGTHEAATMRFAQKGDACEIALDTEKVLIEGPGDLAEFLFGTGPQVHPQLGELPGRLGVLLRESLPLPFPRYDVTYV